MTLSPNQHVFQASPKAWLCSTIAIGEGFNTITIVQVNMVAQIGQVHAYSILVWHL